MLWRITSSPWLYATCRCGTTRKSLMFWNVMPSDPEWPARSLMRLAVITLLLALSVPQGADAAERRVALIIGNGAYTHASELPNPRNDARAMADALRDIGFTSVMVAEDLDRVAFQRTLQKFTRETQNSDMALVFYAGHGIEMGGQNYLIPVDATLASDTDVAFEAVPLDLVMRSVEGARRLRIVLLDACRNNPFATRMVRSLGGSRSVGRGLARIEPPGDMLVAYAAKAGQVAEDGIGFNSPFTSGLLEHITTPGLEIQFLMRKVRDSVLQATSYRQEPHVYGSLGGDSYYLVPPEQTANTSAAGGSGETRMAVELAFWKAIEASGNVAAFEEYLHQFPEGVFAGLARLKITNLEAADEGRAGAETASLGEQPQAPSQTPPAPDPVAPTSRVGASRPTDDPSTLPPLEGAAKSTVSPSVELLGRTNIAGLDGPPPELRPLATSRPLLVQGQAGGAVQRPSTSTPAAREPEGVSLSPAHGPSQTTTASNGAGTPMPAESFVPGDTKSPTKLGFEVVATAPSGHGVAGTADATPPLTVTTTASADTSSALDAEITVAALDPSLSMPALPERASIAERVLPGLLVRPLGKPAPPPTRAMRARMALQKQTPCTIVEASRVEGGLAITGYSIDPAAVRSAAERLMEQGLPEVRSITIQPLEEAFCAPLAFARETAWVDEREGAGLLTLRSAKRELFVEDRLVVELATASGFVTALLFDSEGKARLLPSVRLDGPAQARSLDDGGWRLTRNPGRHLLMVVATDGPITLKDDAGETSDDLLAELRAAGLTTPNVGFAVFEARERPAPVAATPKKQPTTTTDRVAETTPSRKKGRDPRCGDIILKAQLGEKPDNEAMAFLRENCR